MNTWIKNGMGAAAIIAVVLGTGWAVQHYHKPGQLDVVTAQAMDMSQMRPPTGGAPVALASVRQGSLANTVTYTGSVAAYNEQDISPRITGTLVSLPVYPGNAVRAGQVVAQLDTAEIRAKASQAVQEARQAQLGAKVAHLTHYLHHKAALEQAAAQADAARAGVTDAQAAAQAAQDAIADAQAGVQSAQASADYWKTEITREKSLADAGAASQQEYQSELSQAQAAQSALTQAKSKVSQARATALSAQAKVQAARRQVVAAQAGVLMVRADIAVAQGQARQAEAGASAAQAASQAAAVQQGYSRIVSPFGGVVTGRLVSPGTLVQPGTVILKVAEIDRVRVRANVAVEDMAGIRIGSPVRIVVANDKTLTARVSSVFPSASEQTRTAAVEAVVPNPGHRLLPGAFVTMQITNGKAADKLLVPATAIVTEGGVSYVWLASGGAAVSTALYKCEKCGMTYSAADAKKNHFVDPMDGGRLLPVSPASSPSAQGLTAREVSVQAGASDGTWTEITGGVPAGSRVVTQGQAGLTEGARLIATAWGADGPETLPTGAAALGSQTVYKCEKCGMTYSAADAKKNHFIDPMDGGKLVPVQPSMPGMKM